MSKLHGFCNPPKAVYNEVCSLLQVQNVYSRHSNQLRPGIYQLLGCMYTAHKAANNSSAELTEYSSPHVCVCVCSRTLLSTAASVSVHQWVCMWLLPRSPQPISQVQLFFFYTYSPHTLTHTHTHTHTTNMYIQVSSQGGHCPVSRQPKQLLTCSFSIFTTDQCRHKSYHITDAHYTHNYIHVHIIITTLLRWSTHTCTCTWTCRVVAWFFSQYLWYILVYLSIQELFHLTH